MNNTNAFELATRWGYFLMGLAGLLFAMGIHKVLARRRRDEE